MALKVVSVLLIALICKFNRVTLIQGTTELFAIIKCTAARIKPAPSGNRTWVSIFSRHKLYHPAKWSSVVIMVVFSYVNLTAGRNFNFKPDLTLIQATT